MKANNQWMNSLSQFIKSDPFIIAGTSLDEIDLRYYLSFRDENVAAGVRAPSVLIKPHPDAMAEHKCRQYGLILFEGTLIDFFTRFRQLYPHVPRLDSFVPVTAATMFSLSPEASELARFLGDFSIVERVNLTTQNVQSKFFFGSKPSWSDFERHHDIDRTYNKQLIGYLRNFVDGKGPALLYIISGEAGSGKTTSVCRVLYDLAVDGAIILVNTSESRPDLTLVAKMLNSLKKRAIVYFDRGADASPWVNSLFQLVGKDKICFVLSDRSYRADHIKVVTSGIPHEIIQIGKPTVSEYKKLIKAYFDKGLIGFRQARTNPGQFAKKIKDDPIALAVCRILNDFRPVDSIAESLLRDASELERKVYLTAALAAFCHAGVRFSILREMASRKEIEKQAHCCPAILPGA